MVASKVTDLGGGTWHYEYAFYNRRSHRAVDGFTVPVGAAVITNVGFRDIDQDGGNDWTATVAGSNVSWSTTTNPIEYQHLYNFRFDANVGPTTGQAIGDIYRAGIGTSFNISTQVPNGATSIDAGPSSAEELRLTGDPNPFSESTRLSFALTRQQSAKLEVLDVTGRTVRVLIDGPAPAGPNSVRWNGRDAAGSAVASGVYFFRLTTEEGSRTIKSTYLR
jgi:hypothetical protein